MNNNAEKILNEKFEANHNLTGFFNLLFKIAIKNKIDIGQYENNRNTNNPDKSQ